jgi:hypothetical protein
MSPLIISTLLTPARELALLQETQTNQATALAAANVTLAESYNTISQRLKDARANAQDLQAADAAAARIGTQAADVFVATRKQQIDASTQVAQAQVTANNTIEQSQAQSQTRQLQLQTQYATQQQSIAHSHAREEKELKEKQLAVEFALALAKALVAGLSEGGLPGAVVGDAFVAAQYAAQLAIMSTATFGDGGILQGQSHLQGGIPTRFGILEGNEAIINKRSMASTTPLQVAGTPAQIAAAINTLGGGINFAPGATMAMDYAGSLGAALLPPILPTRPATTTAQDNNEIQDMLRTLHTHIQATNNRIDRLTVTLDPNQITGYQHALTKKTNLSTI